MLRVGALVSGRGSNLRALLERQRDGSLGAEVVVVVSNHPHAGALDLAAGYGVETLVCEQPKGMAEREPAQLRMSAELEARRVGLVVNAGFDRILVPAFVRRWSGRIINVHPSLLPAFAGTLHAQAEALRYGVHVAGCSVHFVTEEVDGGPIIAQAAVPVLDGDDVASLSARILEQEHRLLPEVVRRFARGELKQEGRRVLVDGGTA